MTGKRIIVHSLVDAEVAAAAASMLGVDVTLVSARGMAGFMGPLWFKALCNEAAAAHPAAAIVGMLDCADEPGTVLAALRAGFTRVRFTGDEAIRARLDDIARQLGATVEGEAPGAELDLLDDRDPAAACRAFLAPD